MESELGDGGAGMRHNETTTQQMVKDDDIFKESRHTILFNEKQRMML